MEEQAMKSEIKSENRIPKVERSSNSEGRRTGPRIHIRPSDFGLLSGFDLRISAFIFPLQLLLTYALSSAQEPPKPLTRVHAHNDYEHKRPLFDALDHGFCSVEADIYLVDGQLLVAHMRSQVKPERTLEKLYLDPLRERVKQNRGRVYAGGPEVTLLIDIKTDWKTTYPALRERLKKYSDILSNFPGDTKQTNAVIAIITGDRSKKMFEGETLRYAALDGDLEDLDSNAPPILIPWISSNWTRTFHWRGSGEFPANEKAKLKEIVNKAHAQGRRVRFWGAPDFPAFWRELLACDVDLINTDDLEGARDFLLQKKGHDQ